MSSASWPILLLWSLVGSSRIAAGFTDANLRSEACVAVDLVMEHGPRDGSNRLAPIGRDVLSLAWSKSTGRLCGTLSDDYGRRLVISAPGPGDPSAPEEPWEEIRELPVMGLAWMFPLAPAHATRRSVTYRGVPAELAEYVHRGERRQLISTPSGAPLALTVWRMGVVDDVRYTTGDDAARVFERTTTDFRARAVTRGVVTKIETGCPAVEARIDTCLAGADDRPTVREASRAYHVVTPHLLNPSKVTLPNPATIVAPSLVGRFWRDVISLADGPRCPHYPTCSQYCALAIRRHGWLKGLVNTVSRIYGEASDLESEGFYRLAFVNGRWRVDDPP